MKQVKRNKGGTFPFSEMFGGESGKNRKYAQCFSSLEA